MESKVDRHHILKESFVMNESAGALNDVYGVRSYFRHDLRICCDYE